MSKANNTAAQRQTAIAVYLKRNQLQCCLPLHVRIPVSYGSYKGVGNELHYSLGGEHEANGYVFVEYIRVSVSFPAFRYRFAQILPSVNSFGTHCDFAVISKCIPYVFHVWWQGYGGEVLVVWPIVQNIVLTSTFCWLGRCRSLSCGHVDDLRVIITIRVVQLV